MTDIDKILNDFYNTFNQLMDEDKHLFKKYKKNYFLSKKDKKKKIKKAKKVKLISFPKFNKKYYGDKK